MPHGGGVHGATDGDVRLPAAETPAPPQRSQALLPTGHERRTRLPRGGICRERGAETENRLETRFAQAEESAWPPRPAARVLPQRPVRGGGGGGAAETPAGRDLCPVAEVSTSSDEPRWHPSP